MNLRQVALGCDDLTRARDFYTRLLGKEPMAVFAQPGFCFFDLDGTRLLIEIGGPKSLIYMGVDDVREFVGSLKERGFAIKHEPHIVFPDTDGVFDNPGNEWLAFIEDSEGNLVGLMSRERI
jgi:methylmalonyl-CoA/ethylmalonyl-CoA epimerase